MAFIDVCMKELDSVNGRINSIMDTMDELHWLCERTTNEMRLRFLLEELREHRHMLSKLTDRKKELEYAIDHHTRRDPAEYVRFLDDTDIILVIERDGLIRGMKI